MGGFFAFVIGLPFCAIVWVGAAWLVSVMFADIKAKIACGKLADEKVREEFAEALQRVRRGY